MPPRLFINESSVKAIAVINLKMTSSEVLLCFLFSVLCLGSLWWLAVTYNKQCCSHFLLSCHFMDGHKILIHISTTTVLGTSIAVLLNSFSIICDALQVRKINKVKPAGMSQPLLYCSGASQEKYGWVMGVILVMLKKLKNNINCAPKIPGKEQKKLF